MVNSKFVGTGKKLTATDIKRVAKSLGVEEAALRAVIQIESAGYGFYSSTKAPVMLYEPHIAYRRTSGTVRSQLVAAKVAYSRWGLRPYPKSHSARYAQLEKAIKIAGNKAYEFASYGLPQMMGFNYKICGFDSAKEMFDAFKESEYTQLVAMGEFIRSNGKMHQALIDKNWSAFAYRYNGSGYKKNNYHVKLANAYAKFARNPLKDPLDDGFLSRGDKGEAVREVQEWLNSLNEEDIDADGHFGAITEQTVKDWELNSNLVVDGKLDVKQISLLKKAAEGHDDEPFEISVGVGSKGENVKIIQESLIKLGYSVGDAGADGIFGKKTEEAVIAWQKDNSLLTFGSFGHLVQKEIDILVKLAAAVDEPDPEPEPRPLPEFYIVQSGDTLAKIAQRFLGNGTRWKELAEINNIRDASKIYPGQKVYFKKPLEVETDSDVSSDVSNDGWTAIINAIKKLMAFFSGR